MILSEYKILNFHSIDSTQKEMHRRFHSGDISHGDVITAFHQSDSIGRHDRKWVSLEGNSSISIALNIGLIENIAEITFVSAIACGNGILSLSPKIPIKYKWVNDIIIEDSKVGGILCQYYHPYIIIGIGVNIESSPLLEDKKTTYLKKYGYKYNYIELNNAILENFKLEYNSWLKDGVANSIQRWKKMSHTHGEELIIKIGDVIHNGSYLGINESGAIIIKDSLGKIRTITCGEVL